MAPDRIGKAALVELIAAGYPLGYGPKVLAKLSGYSVWTVMAYADDLGLRCLTTRPKPPKEPPYKFLLLIAKLGLKNTLLERSP